MTAHFYGGNIVSSYRAKGKEFPQEAESRPAGRPAGGLRPSVTLSLTRGGEEYFAWLPSVPEGDAVEAVTFHGIWEQMYFGSDEDV